MLYEMPQLTSSGSPLIFQIVFARLCGVEGRKPVCRQFSEAVKLQKITFFVRNYSYWRLFPLHTPPLLLQETPPGEFGVKTKRQRALLHAVSASGHSKLTIDYYRHTSPSENIV